MLCKHLVQTLGHTHARFNARCTRVSLCFRSSVVIDSYWCWCDWFCLFAFAFSDVLFHKVSRSCVRVCPRHCFSTYRWACSPRTRAHFGPITTACVSSHGTGLPPLATPCSRMWSFLWRLHILEHFSRCSDCSTQKLADDLPLDILVLGARLNVCFHVPLGAGGTGLTAWVA